MFEILAVSLEENKAVDWGRGGVNELSKSADGPEVNQRILKHAQTKGQKGRIEASRQGG